ncbi:hypothetical protein D3C75_699190 [compost metagenome]
MMRVRTWSQLCTANGAAPGILSLRQRFQPGGDPWCHRRSLWRAPPDFSRTPIPHSMPSRSWSLSFLFRQSRSVLSARADSRPARCRKTRNGSHAPAACGSVFSAGPADEVHPTERNKPDPFASAAFQHPLSAHRTPPRQARHVAASFQPAPSATDSDSE